MRGTEKVATVAVLNKLNLRICPDILVGRAAR